MTKTLYEKERDRISTKCGMPLDQTRYQVYGTEGFYYPVLSASGDSYGILYALTDERPAALCMWKSLSATISPILTMN